MRREPRHPGAQLSLFEERDSWRYQAFVTNTKVGQLAFLEAPPRGTRPSRGPHPPRQGPRTRALPVAGVRHQPDLADARPDRCRSDRLDGLRRGRRRPGCLRAEGAAVPLPTRPCSTDPQRPTTAPADPPGLAMGDSRRAGFRQHRRDPASRLTVSARPLHHHPEPRSPAAPASRRRTRERSEHSEHSRTRHTVPTRSRPMHLLAGPPGKPCGRDHLSPQVRRARPARGQETSSTCCARGRPSTRPNSMLLQGTRPGALQAVRGRPKPSAKRRASTSPPTAADLLARVERAVTAARRLGPAIDAAGVLAALKAETCLPTEWAVELTEQPLRSLGS